MQHSLDGVRPCRVLRDLHLRGELEPRTVRRGPVRSRRGYEEVMARGIPGSPQGRVRHRSSPEDHARDIRALERVLREILCKGPGSPRERAEGLPTDLY